MDQNFEAMRRDGNMVCVKCGCFSSAQTCWHCSNNQALRLADIQIADLRARLEQAEARCKVLQTVADAAQKFVATPQVDPDEYDGQAYEICCSALNELEKALQALSNGDPQWLTR